VRAASLAAIALACAAPLPGPLPHVVSAEPHGAVAPDDVTVEIAFSAPVDARGLEDGRFFALCRREDLREVVLQAEMDQGLGAGAPVVPARAVLDAARTRVVLRPTAALDPDGAWAAVLSRRARSADGRPVLDPEGRPRTFALLFETGPAVDRAPPSPRWRTPPHGPAPANVASLRVAYDEPVEGALALGPGAPPSHAIAVAQEVLGLDLASPLAAGELAVDVTGVHDLAGNASAPLAPLAVSACTADAAPPLAPGVRATARELSVEIEGVLSGMGRLAGEVSSRPGEPACGIAPEAPATAALEGEVLPCPGWDPCAPAATSCPAAIEVRGLCPGARVLVRLATEDLAGHRGAPAEWMEIGALPPRPAPVVTEVLADADAPEAGGEYVEVANLGTGDADLTGFALAKRGTSGAYTRCKLAPLSGGPIPPGAHALVVGGAYDGRYPLPEGTPLYRCGATSLDGGLANDRPVALALEDALGEVVSTAGIVEGVERCTQGSLERIHPAGPDASSSWACPGTSTPGVCNRSTPPEECPKRPW